MTARDDGISRALQAGWWLLIALLPIGNVTGLRNTVSVLVVLATLVDARRQGFRDLPARTVLLLLVAWCAASIGWSSVPAISFAKWRVDLLLPLLAYAAAFALVRRSGSCAAVVGGTATAMIVLALLSAVALLPAPLQASIAHWVPMQPFTNVASPLPRWYPGVGDASMAAALGAGMLLLAPQLWPRMPRTLWVAALLSVALVLVVANNRNALLAIPVVAVVVAIAMRRRSSRVTSKRRAGRIVLAGLAGIVLAGALVVVLESGARERLAVLGTPAGADESALVTLTARDTRPMIWAYYGRLALDSPIIGVGFGRTVPGIHFETQQDRRLASVESNAYIHAHNLFLNWWLQTGVIGVGLLLAALVEIVRRASRSLSSDDPQMRAAAITVCALVGLLLLRNATDDFLVFGMATLFWALVGSASALAVPRTVGRSASAVAGDDRAQRSHADHQVERE